MSDPRAADLRKRIGAAMAILAGPLLLAVGIWVHTATLDLSTVSVWRRLWNDLALATASWTEATYGPAAEAVQGSEADDIARGQILERIANQGLSPKRPFERVRKVAPFLEQRIHPERRPYDDRGRSALLALAFRLRGGIAPFLILWLGFFVAAPALAWTVVELRAAGRGRAATVVLCLLGLSPFLAGALSLGRYPVGFYLAAVLLIPPLAVYARLHPGPTASGLLARTLIASFFLAVCVFCRSSAGVLAPGFMFAVWLGARRTLKGAGRQAAFTAVAALLLTMPSALAPGSQQNDMWQPVWEGLGDFDRTRGFTWADKTAREVVQRSGGPDLWTEESEAILRDQVIEAIRSDPAWYAAILSKRLASTVSLWRLWPWTPMSGDFMHRSTSVNEGVIDKYWTYTPTVDFIGFSSYIVEIPIPLLVLPTLALIALAIRGTRTSEAREALLVLACLALATLPLPVLITTAGGQEGQAFALVHLFAAGFMVDILTRRRS